MLSMSALKSINSIMDVELNTVAFKQLFGQQFTVSSTLYQLLYYIILCIIDPSFVHKSVKWTSLTFLMCLSHLTFVEGFADVSGGLQTLQCR